MGNRKWKKAKPTTDFIFESGTRICICGGQAVMTTERKDNHKDRDKGTIVFHGVHPATVGTDQRLPLPGKLWSQVVESGVKEFVLCPWFHSRVRLFVPQQWGRLGAGLREAEFSNPVMDKFWDFVMQEGEPRPVPHGGKIYVPAHVFQLHFGVDVERRQVVLIGKPGAIDVCRQDIYLARRNEFLASKEAESEIMGLLAKTGFFRPFSGAASSDFY